ncbi:MAG TPA: formate dehydrogenase accessory sulfurtransferase FdhD [Desulfobacteraceae bacterium]|nr:formate dehydrogenase accessory sulfurtransferase FdhD [Desulfobacteraceae bacterium]
MPEIIVKKKIKRLFLTGKIEELEDEVIHEYRLQIRIDDEDFVEAVVSPSQLEEFVLGFLLTRGLIDRMEDITSLEISKDMASIWRDPRVKEKVPTATLLESTGSRNLVPGDHSGKIQGIFGSGLKVRLDDLIEGIRMLKKMPVFNRTGGTHCAILFSPSGEALFTAEDLGRHNAVDKVIGGGLINSIDFNRCWLAVSGRLPRDMVFKAVLAGIPLMASVSAVTSEGAVTGEKSGVTVVGFGREGRVNCYSHPDRIISRNTP